MYILYISDFLSEVYMRVSYCSRMLYLNLEITTLKLSFLRETMGPTLIVTGTPFMDPTHST